jgi:polysaccharide export outer membrane protein
LLIQSKLKLDVPYSIGVLVKGGSMPKPQFRKMKNKTTKVSSHITRAAFIGVLVFLAGCGSLPSSGPSTSKILSRGKAETRSSQGKFTLIPVTDSVVDAIRTADISCGGIKDMSLNLGKAPQGVPASQSISIGDVVTVTIYTTGGGLFGGGGVATTSAGMGGLSMPGQGGGVSMGTSVPNQVVDDSESITVPYVGRIKVAGKSPSQVESEIAERMKGMAFNPYAVVTLGERIGSDLVTVTGDVKLPRRIPIPLPGLRIADAITEAGGGTAKGFETVVTLLRGSTARSAYFSEILSNPSSNIYLKPADTLVVRARPWSFVTLGATGQALRPFPAERITVAEAIASGNGLDDNRANPEALFLIRLESPSVLNKIGGSYRTASNPEGVPVIYQINLRDPKGFFMAKQFLMRDKDVLYVGSAGSMGVQKVMNVIGALTSPAMTGLAASAGVTTVTGGR